MGLQEVTGGYKGFYRITRGYSRLQGLQEVAGSYKGLRVLQ